MSGLPQKLSFGRVSLTAAVSLLALGFALQAAAQTSSTTAPQAGSAADESVVVVTGVRRAAQRSQDIKKKADLVVDSIVAEDVGKLPDNNVADALARVTGIQVRRDSGEASSVLVRGLPNIVTLLNGREVFTSAGRYINFADVPANMLQRVDVYKTASPEQIEGGISGAVDVRTRRPFDFKGFQLNGNIRGVYSDKSKKYDPDAGVTISNRWDTGAGEVGALLGLSTSERHFHEERAFNIRWTDQGNIDPTVKLPTGVTSIKAPFVMGYIPIEGDRKRDAINFALQWRPDADTEAYLEGFASKYNNDFELDFLVGLPLLGNPISATVFPGTNLLKTLTNKNVFTINSTQANHADTLTQQISLGGSKVVGVIKYSTDLTFTDSKFNFRNPIMDATTTVPLVKVDTSHDGYAQLDYSGGTTNYSYKDGKNFGIGNFFDQFGTQTGKAFDWRGDATYTPSKEGVLKEIKVGVRYADRTATNINAYNGGAPGFPNIPTSTLPGLDGLSVKMASGKDYITTQWYTPSASYLLNNTDLVRKATALNYIHYDPVTRAGTTAEQFALTNDPVTGKRKLDPGSYFSDKEVTKAFYMQAKLGGDIGSVPWSGVFGVRVVTSDQTLSGNNAQAGKTVTVYKKDLVNGDPADGFRDTTASENFILKYTPSSAKNSTTDILPSANLKFNLRPDVIAHISAGRTVTRPDFGALNPGLSLSRLETTSSASKPTGSGGNPNLKQTTSDALDGSLEWYFAQDGLLTGTYFHRNIEGYVVGGDPVDTVIGGTHYDITRPVNSGRDKIDGMEVDYRQFYSELPGIFGGLGLEANVTYIQASEQNATSGVKTAFRGLSKLSYNIIGLYERGPWSGRLAYNWREHYLDTPNFEGDALDLMVKDTSVLDGSVAYKLNSKVTLTLEGNNLLDTDFHDYFQYHNNGMKLPRDLRRYDRTILFGLRFKM